MNSVCVFNHVINLLSKTGRAWQYRGITYSIKGFIRTRTGCLLLGKLENLEFSGNFFFILKN